MKSFIDRGFPKSRSRPAAALLALALCGIVRADGQPNGQAHGQPHGQPHAQAVEVAQPPEISSGRVDRAAVRSRHFMVATANPLATEAGYQILREGGNAADAAVAVQLVLGLVEPQSSGLGGGALLLYRDAAANQVTAYDGRETAPSAARPDRFLDARGDPLAFYDAVIGGRSVGVPGTMRLLEAVQRRHGRLPWKRLFEPAIAIAERGFAISPRLHALVAAETHWTQPRARNYFLTADGVPRPAGSLLTNPAYARTLRALATRGADALYTGPIADDIVRTADLAPAHPGDLTARDLADYRVVARKPVCGGYRSYRVCGMPAPSSGGIAVLQILGMLEPYDVRSMGVESFWSVHFITEAERLAFADRDAWIADPAYVPTPPGLLDPHYLHRRSMLISPFSSIGHAMPGDPRRRIAQPAQIGWGIDAAAEFPSTSQVAIVDREGNAVSMTTTIEAAFGSHLMTEGGFLLNNELTDFSFVPVVDGKPVANRVEPGKRPRSSMAPTIVFDRRGRLFAVLGSAGGSLIINDVTKTLVGIIDWHLDPQAAIALPNFGSRNGPTELEKDTPVVALEPRLRAIGHATRIIVDPSGVQAIVHTATGWIGGADPRREGVVNGD
ncbi:MAG TPA: gamma-glutamyltransferase [Casimicrobiaceae bacterium]|nr:gamma-glutamyltransferase [Casimicrobiaceae bacterium]